MRQCKIVALLLALFISLTSTVSAEEPTSVYDAIENSKGNATDQPEQKGEKSADTDVNPSLFSLLIRLVVSLTFIILLMYVVLKFWAQKTRGLQARGPFLVLGGCPLGTNRSLQAVLIGKTIYILGVGDDVRLIREVPEGEEYDLILSSFESQTGAGSPSLFEPTNWFKKKASSSEMSWEDQLQAQLRELENDKVADDNEWMVQGKKGADWK